MEVCKITHEHFQDQLQIWQSARNHSHCAQWQKSRKAVQFPWICRWLLVCPFVCLIWGLSSLVVLDFYVEVCIITHGHFQDLSCNQTVHHFGQNISLQWIFSNEKYVELYLDMIEKAQFEKFLRLLVDYQTVWQNFTTVHRSGLWRWRPSLNDDEGRVVMHNRDRLVLLPSFHTSQLDRKFYKSI